MLRLLNHMFLRIAHCFHAIRERSTVDTPFGVGTQQVTEEEIRLYLINFKYEGWCTVHDGHIEKNTPVRQREQKSKMQL